MSRFLVLKTLQHCNFSQHSLQGLRILYYSCTLCFKRTDHSDSSFRPKYNYGLSGRGKIAESSGNRKGAQNIQLHGEVLFGIHPVLLALQSTKRKRFFSLFIHNKQKARMTESVSQIQTLAEDLNVPIAYVPKDTLIYLSCNRPHQGVCLDAGELVLPEYQPEYLVQRKGSTCSKQLWLLLYNIQDPMNFGAILRSSYFLGVSQVVVTGTNSCMASPVVSKASAGALEVVNLCCLPREDDSVVRLIKAWQVAGGEVVGTTSMDGINGRRVLSLKDYILTQDTLLIAMKVWVWIPLFWISATHSLRSLRQLVTRVDLRSRHSMSQWQQDTFRDMQHVPTRGAASARMTCTICPRKLLSELSCEAHDGQVKVSISKKNAA